MAFDPVEADKNDPLNWTRDEFELPLRSESGGEGQSRSRSPPQDPEPWVTQ